MRPVAAAAFAGALALAACGGDSDTASTGDTSGDSGTAGSASGEAVVIKNFEFNPDKLTAKVGDKIEVTNKDSATHTLTAKDKSVDTGDLDEGESATVTLDKAGTLDYVCSIHPYMTGTIEVTQ